MIISDLLQSDIITKFNYIYKYLVYLWCERPRNNKNRIKWHILCTISWWNITFVDHCVWTSSNCDVKTKNSCTTVAHWKPETEDISQTRSICNIKHYQLKKMRSLQRRIQRDVAALLSWLIMILEHALRLWKHLDWFLNIFKHPISIGNYLIYTSYGSSNGQYSGGKSFSSHFTWGDHIEIPITFP